MPPGKRFGFKVGVVGTINRDTIHREDGSRIDSFGGILYNLKYLGEGNSVKAYPVVNVGYDCYPPIMSILKSLKNVDTSLVRKVAVKNNHCFLQYSDQTHKCEFLAGGVPPLTYGRVRPLRDCDLILVNFITGNDIKLAALERLRMEYRGLIYMDLHSLSLGMRRVEDGIRRYLRRPRYWRRYIACADILQVNRAEFEILSGTSFSNQKAQHFYASELKTVKCLNVTLGAQGSVIVYRKKRIVSRAIASKRVKRIYDTTGCGDVFAAGYIMEYLRSGSYPGATVQGNRLAAARCLMKGPVF